MAAKKKPWKNGYVFHFFLILGVEHVESEANFASFIRRHVYQKKYYEHQKKNIMSIKKKLLSASKKIITFV